MNFSEICDAVCDEVGVGRPSTYFGNTDGTARQMIALMQTEGNDLARRTRWENLIREAVHTTLAQEDQGAITTIAPGYRSFINRTQWNRDRQWPLRPDTPQIWQSRKATANTGIFNNFRLRGGKLLMTPAPPAGETVAFEYNSKYFCQSAALVAQAAWAADTDLPLLDEFLMKLGLLWRFKKSKGLDYGEEFRLYEERVADAIGQDGGAAALNMGDSGGYQPGIGAPEGSWNL